MKFPNAYSSTYPKNGIKTKEQTVACNNVRLSQGILQESSVHLAVLIISVEQNSICGGHYYRARALSSIRYEDMCRLFVLFITFFWVDLLCPWSVPEGTCIGLFPFRPRIVNFVFLGGDEPSF